MAAATALRVDPANAGQARAWDGDEGAYWADHPARFVRSLVALVHELRRNGLEVHLRGIVRIRWSGTLAASGDEEENGEKRGATDHVFP